MIRIDLLPDYVAKRRLTLLLMWVFGVLFVTITCGMLAVNFIFLAPKAVEKQQEATDAETAKGKLDDLKAQTASTLAEVQPIQDKLQFVDDVQNYNRSWVALYDQLARYTDPKLVYASAAVSGASMAISAYTPSIDEVGRYLEKMYEEPDFTTVTIDHLPGYPESVINKYYLNGKLIAVGELPGLNDARPGQGQGQAGGQYGGNRPGQSPYGGGQPGQSPYGGGQPGQSPYGGGQPGQNGSLTASGLPTFGTVINPLTAQEIPDASLDGFIDQIVSPLATGDQVVRLRNVVREHLLHQVIVKHQIRGFQISVSATLKKPFVAPVVPSAGGAAAATTASNGFAGMPGGPGGMPGMPGGPGGMPGGPGGMSGPPGMRTAPPAMGQPGKQ